MRAEAIPTFLFALCVYTVYIVSMTRVKSISSASLTYRINDRDHNPPHVHVEGRGASVRINLLTLEPMDDTDFGRATMREIIRVVTQNRAFLLEEWETKHGED